jgi:outer membrane cobalamin receptor
MRFRFCFAPGIEIVLLLFALSASAQSTATLTGSVIDPGDAAIAQAEILVERCPGAGAATIQRATSDSNGRFTASLEPGTYRIRVTHASFAPYEEVVTLAAGQTRELRVRLELERLAATVVVTAQAEPASAEATTAPVTVLTRKVIEQRQAVSLGPLLESVPGFSLSRLGREGGLTTLFLDGGNSNFTKVLVDGTTVNDPGGALDLSNFTLENVEKVEVVRGAESALFGSDAMAGVVQVFTHRGTTRRPQLTLLSEGGKFAAARVSAQLSGLLRRFDYSAAAAYFHTSGQGVNDRFLNRTLSGNFGWRVRENNTLRLTLRNNTSDAGVPGQTGFEPPNLDEHSALKNFSSNLSWDFATGLHWRHHLAGSESYARQLFDNELSDFFLSPDPFGFCSFPRSPRAVPSSLFCDFPFTARNQINRAGLLEQSSYFFRSGAVTAGYQYEVENAFLNALGGHHVRRNNQAGFFDGRLQPRGRLTISGGFRIEANDSFGTRAVPRIGLLALVRSGRGFWGDTRLRFSYGQGIKEPRLDQSFGTDPCFPGNPNLRPERSRTYNAGLEQRLAADRLRLSADYFDNRFRDMISFGSVVPPPGCVGGFAGNFFNTDLARARGTNISIEARPARWLTLLANYTYDDSRVLRAPNAFDPTLIAGNRLFKRPVHSGNLILNAAFRRMNWNLAGYFTGRRTDSDFLGLGVTRNPGYARFDLGGSYTVHRGVTLFAHVENLFDKRYEDAIGYPAYRRAYRAGMKFTLGGE